MIFLVSKHYDFKHKAKSKASIFEIVSSKNARGKWLGNFRRYGELTMNFQR